jgi:hypothetical protein
MKTLGLILVVAGVITLANALAYGGFTTRPRPLLQIDSIVTDETGRRTIPVPPIAGGAALIAGLALLLSGRPSVHRDAS